MYRILISGYYGFNNIGDEAILRIVIENLREKIPDADITILSHNPEDTIIKYGVKAVPRKSPIGIFRSILSCDILISGGGSLLQDATSRISIIYYLAIIRLALLLGKKAFIYSQGVGPINRPFNMRLTARVLSKVHGIVVRDEQSAELLREIGVNNQEIHVTADPTLRMRRPSIEFGAQLLQDEGFLPSKDRLTVGWAIKAVRGSHSFMDEIEKSVRWLNDTYGAVSVLIPFHYEQDLDTVLELERRLKGSVIVLRKKHLSDEMLSIIGNMDVLVGVRLHSLIYAAIMGIPIIGISYDPKIDAFLHSVSMEPVATANDFTAAIFGDAFEDILKQRDTISGVVSAKVRELRATLDTNEALITDIMSENTRKQSQNRSRMF